MSRNLANLRHPSAQKSSIKVYCGIPNEIEKTMVDWIKAAIISRIFGKGTRHLKNQSAPFQLLGIDHVVLRAVDAPRLVDFYVKALGCTLQWERPELGLYHLAAGSALLDIVSMDGPLGTSGVAAAAPLGRNVDHVCFQVDVIEPEALGKHLRTFGLEMDEPRTRFGAKGFGLSVYLQDPEGNGIELKEAAASSAATSRS